METGLSRKQVQVSVCLFLFSLFPLTPLASRRLAPLLTVPSPEIEPVSLFF